MFAGVIPLSVRGSADEPRDLHQHARRAIPVFRNGAVDLEQDRLRILEPFGKPEPEQGVPSPARGNIDPSGSVLTGMLPPMEKRRLGRTDILVTPLGFGGAETGFGPTNQVDLDRILGSALDAGLNVIDTAECYGNGEEKIGQSVAGRRSEFYLFTKCGHASGFDLPDYDPKMLAQSIDRSLQRLRTDVLDLVQLHGGSETMLRQGDVIDVLRRAKEAGKTRYIGYSGDSTDALYAIECGAFDTLQTSVNVADQECLDLTLPKARERQMGVIAKRPVANIAWLASPGPEDYSRVYWERLRELRYPFLAVEREDSVGYALRFTLSQYVQVAIVGTAKPDRWQQNAEYAAKGPLSPEEIEVIRSRWREVAQEDWVGQG